MSCFTAGTGTGVERIAGTALDPRPRAGRGSHAMNADHCTNPTPGRRGNEPLDGGTFRVPHSLQAAILPALDNRRERSVMAPRDHHDHRQDLTIPATVSKDTAPPPHTDSVVPGGTGALLRGGPSRPDLATRVTE